MRVEIGKVLQKKLHLSRNRLEIYALDAARLLWLGVTVAGLSAFLACLSIVMAPYLQPSGLVLSTLNRLGISTTLYTAVNLGSGFLLVIGFFTVAGVIFIRKPGDWMALFVAFFLVTFGFSTPLASLQPGSLPRLIADFTLVLNTFAWIAINALFYLFPNWRFTPRWAWIPLTALAALILLGLPTSSPLSQRNMPGWLMGMMMAAAWGTAIYAQVYRYRRVSSPTERQQTKWVLYGLVMSMLLGLILNLPAIIQPTLAEPTSLYGLINQSAVSGLFNLLIPASIGVALLRYRLWDIDPIINRTLVYGLLTVLIVGLYTATVSGLGLIFEEGGRGLIPIIATALVAMLFQPLREGLQRGANHLVYGDRDDPYRVLARLGQRLETSLDPDSMLPGIVETVAQSLKLPYAAVKLKNLDGAFRIVAVYPPITESPQASDASGTLSLPLVYQQEMIGQLILAPRAPGEEFSSQDKRLLSDLAHQVGIAAHAVRLTADLRRLTVDLQQSREQLVMAREEERRRIRRDLHDGLGPTLAALALSANSVAELAATQPDAAARLAQEMQQEIRASIADIRRLVYELRPPALDELGLVAAIRDRTAQITHLEEDGALKENNLIVQVKASEPFLDLPAAVEVAAYRIVLEALTNAVRHAQARHCVIHLCREEGTLEIQVNDDGTGLPTEVHNGVGLLSMRERAAELGGSCEVSGARGQGTRVLARLPIMKKER